MAADRSTVITALDNALSRNEVDKYLRQHWARLVPILIAATTDQPVRLKHDEAALRKALLEPIEAFIAGREHSEKADKFQHLKKDDVPNYLCNKNFRAGDPTYSCRECAVDSTCVLCMECFKQSPHQNHRYRISSSGGGGYCDCGDPEAWKQDFACTAHQPPSGHAEDIDVGDARKRLPEDVAKRFSTVVQSALSYAYQMLTLRDGSQSPTEILGGGTPSSSPPKHRSFLTSTSSLLGLGGSKDGEEDELKYATILYNDEVHTYDGVITVLSRTLECTAEEALEYATVVDHEGRCPVKFGTLAECERVKTFVEKNSRRPQPLRLDVILTSVYSHQVFAQLVMKWIQELAEACEGFKALVCDVGLQDSWDIDAVNIVSAFLLVDVRLWKAARNAVHSLFMATFLSFNDAKIAFSRLLAQLYPELMAAFVADDHEHTDSCTSLGVQLFTVPTVARTLLADGLVEVIVKSFVAMCSQRRNDQGRLSFERSTQPTVALQFKRALYTLYDTRYLLNSVPRGDQWNDALRKGFIGTFEQFLQVMEMMEGMDSHVRRTQSHVEYEADWEPAFNVQLRMQSILDLLQQWCASDTKVLEVCVKRLMDSAIRALGTGEKFEKREVAGRHMTQCIEYDVATQVVSIHHPVIRMLASLLVSGLEQDISLDGQRLEYRLTAQAKELMELPLRTLVLVSQANAGMWRRNGYALANQIYFYQQPRGFLDRCREEMLDKDVVMMQACAAVMKPDDCMIAILDKFGLIAWADEVFDATPPKTEEDSIRQVMFLAEEFLYCLIVLIGERYYPGVGRVTAEDCLKNELIHQLCIQSMSYSELLKNLPDQEAKSGELDDIVKEVATFKRTSPTSKGSFELKAEYMNHYNMFFYHYTRIEHSKAEDTQRKRKKKSNEEIVFPPPLPPPFSGVFQNIVKLLDCDVMVHLLNLTVRRALNNHPRSFSEGQLIRALYLIGYGLHEEKRMRQASSNTSPTVKTQFLEKAADAGIFLILRELKTQKDGEAYKSLVEWVLGYYEELTNVRDTTPRTSESMDIVVGSVERSSMLMMGSSPSENEEDMEERKKQAMARRERIMAQMKSAQKNFVSHNLQEMTSLEQPSSAVENPVSIVAETVTPMVVEEKARIAAVGNHRSLHNIEEDLDEKHTCILCSESHAVNLNLEAFVAVAYVQRSTVLSQEDRQAAADHFVKEPASSVKELSQALMMNPLWMRDDLSCAPHVSSCGHLLHAKCWKTYFESVVARERRRTIRLRSNTGSFDVTKNEYRCPLCSRLCNAAIPFFPLTNPKANVHSMDTTENSMVTLDSFIKSVKVLFEPSEEATMSGETVVKMEIDKKGRWIELCSMMVEQSEDHEEQYRKLKKLVRSSIRAKEHAPALAAVQEDSAQIERLRGIDVKNEEVVTEGFVEAIRTFQTQVYQMIMNTSSETEETLSCAVGWSSCSYSIQCIEQCLRNEKKSLLGSLSSRQYLCLKSLIRATCWTSAAYEPKVLTENAVLLFSSLFRSPTTLPLYLDAFSLLINLTCAFPWLPWTEEGFTGQSAGVLICRPPVGDDYDSFLLTLVYALHVTQVVAGLTEDDQHTEHFAEETLPSGDALVELYRVASSWKRPHLEGEVPVKVPKNLQQLVREGVWPLLRSCAIFYHFMTGIAAPESLKKDNPSCDSEYEDLLTYLNLPVSFSHLLDQNPALKQLTFGWFSTSRDPTTLIDIDATSSKPIFRRYPRPRPSFAKLPQDFVDVINRASQKTCKIEADERRSPALCLVCGQLLCSQSMCCQFKMDNGQSIGGCTYHSLTCGGGTGLFLRVRENQVLMLHGSNKGCFGSSPYVDAYGEPDAYLRRGNPLHLSQERLDQLYRHFMHHDIADEVSHAMDQNGTLAGFDWFHF